MHRFLIVMMLFAAIGLTGCNEPQAPPGEPEIEAAEADAALPDAAEAEGPVEVVEVGPPAGEAEDPAGERAAEADDVTAGDVARDLKRAADTSVRYAAEKTGELAAAAKAQFERLDERTEAWRAAAKEKAGEWSEATKQRWRQAMENMEERKQEAKKKWKQLKANSDDAWAAGWAGFQQAMTEAERAYEDAKTELTDRSGGSDQSSPGR